MPTRRSHRIRLAIEQAESRYCLSGIGFVANDIAATDLVDPSDVELADVDGDGDLDAIAASPSLGRILWYENLDGAGSFGKKRIVTIDATDTRHLIVTDIDSDGDLDIVSLSRREIASAEGGRLTWYPNQDTKGNFGPGRSIGTSNIASAEIVDIDGDGFVDLLFAVQGDIAWQRNVDGKGNFGASQPIAGPDRYASSVTSADLDDDGDTDIVAVSRSRNRVMWYEHLDGTGTFADEQAVAVDNPAHVRVADFNNDGRLDILTGNARTEFRGRVDLLIQQEGSLLFHLDVVLEQQRTLYSIEVNDVDGDGDADIVLATNAEIGWIPNQDGGLGPRLEIGASFRFGDSQVAVGDVDGDGDGDVVSVNNNHEMVWHRKDDGGLWRSQTITSPTDGAEASHTADLDGDGDLDVLTSSYGRIDWYRNDGSGDFGQRQIIASTHEYVTLYTSDIDGDGDLDILTSAQYRVRYGSIYDQIISWYENIDGAGRFGGVKRIDSGAAFAISLSLGDIDNDGDVDIIAAPAKIGDYRVVWYSNIDGLGNFGEPQTITTELIGPTAVAVADIDGDGDLDVASSSSFEGKVAWYENSDGKFGEQQLIALDGSDTKHLLTVDLDADGDLDIVTGLKAENRVLWYENLTGAGDFAMAQTITTESNGATPIFAGDFDGDPNVDVLTASYENNRVTWYEKVDGSNEFQEQSELTARAPLQATRFGSRSINVGDIDGNGGLDLVSVFPSSFRSPVGHLTWYEQRKTGDSNGDGEFNSGDLVTVFRRGEYEDGIDGNSIFQEGDWNGDGDFDSSDLVAAFQAGHYVFAATIRDAVVGIEKDATDRLFSNASDIFLDPSLVSLVSLPVFQPDNALS